MNEIQAYALKAGMDFRLPQYRREVFLRFYEWQIRHRSHPGAVYYVLPYVADKLNWDIEQRAWAAFLNGNTQNPVTTLLLMQQGDRPRMASKVLDFYRLWYQHLEWDTDRRHHKSHLARAVDSYLGLLGGRMQVHYWDAATEADEVSAWHGAWHAATAIHGMGRLSAWSYLEYLRVLGVLPYLDADDLMLRDRDGSRSHRNGLLLIGDMEQHMVWRLNRAPVELPREAYAALDQEADRLLAETRARLAHFGASAQDATRLTLESALCTYKSWHLPRRRYPGVYNDLLYNRLRRAENRFGRRWDVIWEARRVALPQSLRLEDNVYDPGAVAVKQNWYLETGQVIGLDNMWSCFRNGFSDNVDNGVYGMRKN